jgi:predicted TIM-barrel fold metal-dependent hydrolase
MIIDSHVHAFPPLADAPGFDRHEEFLALLQRGMARHGLPTRRLSDHAPSAGPLLWSETDPSPAGRQEVSFRVGRFGRLEWSADGVDYYKQYLPAWLTDTAATPDLLVALMGTAGVHRAVLQNDSFYGKLNDFFGECVRAFPDHLIGTIHVDEDVAHTEGALRELHHAASDLGLRGLFFGPHQYWLCGEGPPLDDGAMRAFWQEVEALELVVYWSISGGPMRDKARYLNQLRRIDRMLERHPGVRSVMVGGAPNSYFDDPRTMPPALAALAERESVCFEVVYPVYVGLREEYPFPSARDAVYRLYDRLGPRRLVWGSDLPNVERHCTYEQSLTYLSRHCPAIPPEDMQLILGGNLARLFGLA